MASAAALLVAAEAGSNGVAAVEPGVLDPTFGSDGIVTVDFAEPGVLMSTEGARGVAVQPEAYVGVAPEWSGLDFFYVWPRRDAWEMGSRRGGCSLFDAVGRDLTGSMAGSRQ
jgi:hypothetical protein